MRRGDGAAASPSRGAPARWRACSPSRPPSRPARRARRARRRPRRGARRRGRRRRRRVRAARAAARAARPRRDDHARVRRDRPRRPRRPEPLPRRSSPRSCAREEIGRRGDARVVAWELEVPLFNLSGTLELRPRAGRRRARPRRRRSQPGPRRLRRRRRAPTDARPSRSTRASTSRARASSCAGSWRAATTASRPRSRRRRGWRCARRRLRAEHPRDAARVPSDGAARRVRARASRTDARSSRPPFAPLAARGAAALVSLAPSGRLASVSVSVAAREAPRRPRGAAGRPAELARVPRLARRAADAADAPRRPRRVVVEDAHPVRRLRRHLARRDRRRAHAGGPPIDGAARGAWFGWEVFPRRGARPRPSSRCTRASRRPGSIPRRFIEAEPLLEHGMTLALAFVDAVSATRGGAK